MPTQEQIREQIAKGETVSSGRQSSPSPAQQPAQPQPAMQSLPRAATGVMAAGMATTTRGRQTRTINLEDITGEASTPRYALGVTQNNVPYYGGGMRGWAREIYSDIVERAPRTPAVLTPAQQQRVNWLESFRQNHSKLYNFISNKIFYGMRTAGALAGIQRENVERDISAVENAIAADPGRLVDFERHQFWQFAIEGGVFGGLNLGVQPFRKGFANIQANAELAERYNELPELPQYTWARQSGFNNFAHNLYNVMRVTLGKARDPQQGLGDALLYWAGQNYAPYIAEVVDWLGFRESAEKILTNAAGYTPEEARIVMRNLDASNMVYTAWIDQARWDEAQRRIAAGEDANAVAYELQNPWAEFAGDFVFDFLNVAGAFGKKGATRLANAADDFLRPADEVQNAIRPIQEAMQAKDELSAARRINDAFQGVRNAINNRSAQIVRGITDYRLIAGTSDAKAAIMNKRTGMLLANLIMDNADDALETVSAMIKMTSDNADEALEAWTVLSRHRYANMIFSPAGIDTMFFMRRMTNSLGGLDNLRNMVRGAKDAGELIDNLLPHMEKAVTSAYPSVREMMEASRIAKKGGALSARQRWAAQTWDNLGKTASGRALRSWAAWWETVSRPANKVTRAINSFFGHVYMGFTPGYAFRNLLTDSFTILVEEGTGAAARNVAENVGNLLTFGALRRAETRSLSRVLGMEADDLARRYPSLTAGFAPHAGEMAVGGRRLRAPGFALAEHAEAGSSLTIANRAIRREMRRALRCGVLPSLDDLKRSFVEIGMSEDDAVLYRRLLFESWGDVRKANAAFMKAVSDGEELVRHRIPLPKALQRALSMFPGALDDYLTELRNAESPEEFEKGIDAFRREWDAVAARAEAEMGRVQMVTPEISAEYALNDIENAAKTGLLEGGKDAVIRARQVAQDAAKYHLDSAVDKALQILRQRGYDITDIQLQLRQIENAHFVEAEQLRAFSHKCINETWLRVRDDLRNGITYTSEQYKDLLKGITFTPPYSPRSRPRRIKDIPENLDFDTFKRLLLDFWEQNIREGWHLVAAKRASLQMELFGNLPPELMQEIYNAPEWKRALVSLQELDAYYQADTWEGIVNAYRMSLNAMKVPPGTTLADIASDSLSMYGWHNDRVGLFAAVNADRRAAGLAEAEHFSDIPFEEAIASMSKRVGLLPPSTGEILPTQAHLMRVMQREIFEAVEDYRNAILRVWGDTRPISSNQKLESLLADYERQIMPRLGEARARAVVIAQAERDWILHDYKDKRYFDLVLSYIFPYQFWYSRSYPKWIARLAEHPEILARYARYRKTLEIIHAGLPEWWKYQISTNDIPGLESENPLYFNLEASLNPMNGLVGVDFTDERKRATWYAALVDDLGKYGPSTWMPLQYLVGAMLYQDGEKEAAQRWFGRMFPQTAVLKSLLYQTDVRTGLFNDYNEFDPVVAFVHGGLDPYETRRVMRSLGAMVDEGVITPEQAQDAAYSMSGPIWEEAVNRSQDARFAGQMSSFLLGAGFKARNRTDIEIDNFYTDYYSLMRMRPNLSPDEFRDAMIQLREKYPWMDVMILSSKTGEDRDASYAYSVIGRIPPGQMNDLAEMVGLDGDLLSAFYNSKGDFSSWTQQDRMRFMAAIVDLGAALRIPSTATLNEWNAARTEYANMRRQIEARYGQTIWDEIDVYYSLDRDARREYARRHPRVTEALDMQTEIIANTPLLYRYYGGIETLQRYWSGWVYDQLENEFGSGIQQTWSEYYSLRVSDETAARRFYRQHPELRAYSERKRELQSVANRYIVQFASVLPQRQPLEFREDFEPRGPTQQRFVEQMAVPEVPPWRVFDAALSEPMKRFIIAYYTTGEPLPRAVMDELDYMAEDFGVRNGNELLQLIGISMQQGR